MRARAVTSEACGCCSIRARKAWRASLKRPRAKSLCARSKAWIAAISSCDGLGRGAGLGGALGVGCGRVAADFAGRVLGAAFCLVGLAAGRLVGLAATCF